MSREVSSRISGFYKLSPEQRQAAVKAVGLLDERGAGCRSRWLIA